MPQSSPSLVVVDVETTGLRADHAITELSALAIDLPTRQLISRGYIQIRLTPSEQAKFTEAAREVQGWTPERNSQGLPREVALEQFRAWLAGLNVIGYVAHNADFDRYHLQREGFVPPDRPWYCTRRGLVAYEQRFRTRLHNHKLAALETLCGAQNPDPHRSECDAYIAAVGYLWLTDKRVDPESMRT